MTNSDRDQFLNAIGNIDMQIDDATLAAGDAPAVAQTGNLAKSVLLLANILLYQQPAPTCICCGRLADPALPGDFDLCQPCYNAISAPWPGVDEYAHQVAADLIGAGP